MTTYNTPKVNTAYKFYVALVDQSNTKLTKANPTIASGDFKSSLDGGAFGNLATLPSANPASGRAIMIDLSAAEMNGANVVVQCVDAAGAEWCDLIVNIQTTARQIDDLAFPATTGRSMVVDANGLVDANAVKVGPTGAGTAQTARDIGASVLLSSGTGTGQLKLASGYVAMTWADVAAPTTAVNLSATTVNLANTVTTYTGNTVQTGDAYARLGAPAGASIAADIAAIPAAVWAVVIDGTNTAIKLMRGFAAALLGKASGLATTTAIYRNVPDSKDVITATVDANGNRSAVTTDLT